MTGGKIIQFSQDKRADSRHHPKKRRPLFVYHRRKGECHPDANRRLHSQTEPCLLFAPKQHDDNKHNKGVLKKNVLFTCVN